VTGAVGETRLARYHRGMTMTSLRTTWTVCSICRRALALFRVWPIRPLEPSFALVGPRVASRSTLTARLGLGPSTVSTHVACLRDCGLVEGLLSAGR